jgi:hypothetical protein
MILYPSHARAECLIQRVFCHYIHVITHIHAES